MTELEKYLITKFLEQSYQPLYNWSPTWTDQNYQNKVKRYDNRIEMILSELENPNGKFIDIGCSEGYDSFKIHENGGNVVGVDKVLRALPTAKYLQLYHDITENLKFIKSNIFDFLESNEEHFDYCICFLVLHHFLDKYDNLSDSDNFLTIQGINLLDKIKKISKVSFLQLRLNGRDLEFQEYLMNERGFSDVKILTPPSNVDIKGKEVIFKCTT